MRRTIELRTLVVALIVGIGAGVTPTLLKADQAVSQTDLLPALLSEVRGLRAAIEQMASASSRIQLSVARLQIEEQRINDAGKRLLDLRERLADAQQNLQHNQDESARLERALDGAANLSGEERSQTADRLAQLKAGGSSLRGTVARLSADEAQLTQDLSLGQARWIEISHRLDELEASLIVKR